MKTISNQAGFGLIEVMVALVIGSVVMGAFASISKNMMEANSISSHKLAVSDFQKDVLEALKSKPACTATLAGLTFSEATDLGLGQRRVNIGSIKQESAGGINDMAAVAANPKGFPVPGSPGGYMSQLFVSDFEIVDVAEGRYRARLKMDFDKDLGSDQTSPTGVREVPIFIKGLRAGTNVTLESCSSSSSDWLSEDDRIELASQICTSSGGTYNATTGACTIRQVTDLNTKVLELEAQIRNLNTQISNLAVAVNRQPAATPPPVVYQPPPPPPPVVYNPPPVPTGPTPGTVTGGGTCTFYPAGHACAGHCGGGPGCPSRWNFTGSGQPGGCGGNNRMQNTSVSAPGSTGYVCVAL